MTPTADASRVEVALDRPAPRRRDPDRASPFRRPSRCTTARRRRSRPGCGRGTCRTPSCARGRRRASAAWAAEVAEPVSLQGAGRHRRTGCLRRHRLTPDGWLPRQRGRALAAPPPSASGLTVWFRGWKLPLVSTRPVTGRVGRGLGGPPRRGASSAKPAPIGVVSPATPRVAHPRQGGVGVVDLRHAAGGGARRSRVVAREVGMVGAGEPSPGGLDGRRVGARLAPRGHRADRA